MDQWPLNVLFYKRTCTQIHSKEPVSNVFTSVEKQNKNLIISRFQSNCYVFLSNQKLHSCVHIITLCLYIYIYVLVNSASRTFNIQRTPTCMWISANVSELRALQPKKFIHSFKNHKNESNAALLCFNQHTQNHWVENGCTWSQYSTDGIID